MPAPGDQVQWRDYDGDGDQDVVLLRHEDGGDLARVFRNDGGGVFNAVADCVTEDGVTTCEGDQSAGIIMESGDSPIQLWVQNLTKHVTPTAGLPGIDLQTYAASGLNGSPGVSGQNGGAGLGIQLHFVGPDRAIVTQGDGAHGLYAFSIAGSGGNGGSMGVIGGAGGAGGVGGAITIQSDGAITTNGSSAYGIFASSLGGSGGIGADGMFGAAGGAGGRGGDISIANDGSITATGNASVGIDAWSLGGDGGHGGDGLMGNGGAGGDGGNVSVINHGRIKVSGDGAYGVLATSRGGGGGDPGEGAISGSAGLWGNGGAVFVADSSDIVADGNGSIGILASSLSGTAGAAGHGGEVVVDQTGNITVHGDQSNGIVAESMGYGGYGGGVEVTVRGNITAGGENANGILAVSYGQGGAGPILVRIESGTVRGGTGAGTGVALYSNGDNRVENHGTIETMAGLDGMAIQSLDGSDVVDNFGTVRGVVDLGSGTNLFNNGAGSLFETGSHVELGDNGMLLNSGVVSPGGASVATTTIHGDYTQTADGTLSVTVGKDILDKLIVTGSVSLDGTLAVHPDHDAYLNGTTYDIIESPDVTGAFSKISSTAFLNFETQSAESGVQLKVNVRPFSNASTSPLQSAIASCLDQCILHATGDYSHMIGQFQIASADQVNEAFYSLSPGTYDNLTRSAILSSQLHQDDLLQRMNTARSRPSTEGTASSGRAYEEGRGVWLGGSYLGADQNASGGFFEQTFTTTGARGGYESALGRSIVGASVGYLHSKADLDNDHAHGLMKSYVGSLYGGHLWGRSFAQAVASFLSNKFDNRRALHVGSEERVATSKFDGTALTGLVTGGTRMPAGRWGVEPYAALRYARLSQDGFAETGAGSVNLTVGHRNDNWLASDLGLRFNTTFKDEGAVFLPELHVAWNHDFGLSDRNIVATFEGDPDMPFTIAGQSVKPNGAIMGVGATYLAPGGWKATLRYDHVQRDDFRSNALTLRLGSGF